MTLLLGAAPAAHGHAVLVHTEPGSEQLLAESPGSVELTYTERVSLSLGGVDVFGPAGTTISSGSASASGNRVTVPIGAEEHGTYAVSWRVLSADGHPVSGAFTFSVGERSASSAAADRAEAASSSDRTLTVSFGVVRFIYLIGILLAAGAGVFAAVVAPGWRPRFVGAALFAVVAGSVVGFFLQAAIATGIGVTDTFDGDIVEAQLSTIYGNAAVVRIVLALLCLAALRLAPPLDTAGRGARAVFAGVFVALPLGQSIAGHAMATDPLVLRLPLDMVHVLFAAVWVGGLVQLYRYVSSGGMDSGSIVRYSRVAMVSVAVLVVTGSFAALAESDVSLSALIDTGYGRILLGKIGLFALTMPIANVNRTRNVPAIVAGAIQAPSMLRRFVRFEALILLGVLGLTAWLIESVPARHAVHQAAAQPAGPVSETLTLPSGARATLSVDPAAVGPNAVSVRVVDAAGRPDASISALTLKASLKSQDVQQLPLDVRQRGPGRWEASGLAIPLAGDWRFDIALRRGEFSEERTHVDAEIAAPTQP